MQLFARTAAPPKRPQILAGLGALAVALAVGLLPPLLLGRDVDRTDLYLGLLAGSVFLPLLVEVRNPRGDVLSPAPMMGAIMAMEFVVRCLFLRYGDVRLGDLPPNLGYDYRRFMEPALELTTVAWLAALVAYALPFGRVLVRMVPEVPILQRDINPTRVVIVYLVGLFFKGSQVMRGTHLAFSTPGKVDYDTQSYVDFLSQFSYVAIFLLAALDFRGRLGRTQRLWLWAVMVPSELAWGLLTGGKMRLFMPLMLLLMAYHYFRKRVAMRHLLAAAAVLVFVVLPVVSQFRTAYSKSGATSLSESVRSAQMAGEELRQNDEYTEDSLRGATNRLHGLDSVMVAMKMTPALIPYGDSELYYLLPAMAVVPRILWKTKPIMMVLPNWETEYWGNSRDNPTSISRTHFGALYAVFGWWGTVLGMFLVGLAWRFTYEVSRRNWGPVSAALYVTNLFVLIRLENDIPMVYSQLIKTALVMMLVILFVADGSRARQQAAGTRPALA